MAIKNKSMYAILGILRMQPSTGYDIKKYSDCVLSGFWNENFGHIYPTLRTMLAEGMIAQCSDEKSETDANDTHDRKIRYRITEKGRAEFMAWLAEETVQPPVRSEFMLKLLFSDQCSNEQIMQMLMTYRQNHVDSIARYRNMLEELDGGIDEVSPERARFIRVVLRKGIISSEADIQWCDETMHTFFS